jgi:hypothetical protein
MVGLPLHQKFDPKSNNPAARATPKEIEDMISLREERKTFGDIVVLPVRDVYEDLFVKTFQILDWTAREAKGELVALHDDEYCANVQELEKMCQEAVFGNADLYGGYHLWRTPGYEIQKGFDGSFSPYFSGWISVLSRNLVNGIVNDPESILSAIYASHSEDLQVGRWVENQIKNGFTQAIYSERPSLLVKFC